MGHNLSCQDRDIKDLFIRYLINTRTDLTYISGAVCTDGVTLVGDRKITVGLGTEHTYAKKIFSPLVTVVVGSSGASGMYRTFQSRLILGVQDVAEQNQGKNINWNEHIILLAERIIHELADSYGKEITASNLDALIGLRQNPIPELIHLSGFGLPEPVSEYATIGHGEPYGSILLKTLWKKNKPMDMRKFAKIACLAIKYIQDLNLDNSVGMDTDQYPQVWFLPKLPTDLFTSDNLEENKKIWDRYPLRELSDYEVQTLMNESKSYISQIKNTIESFKL